MKNNVILTIQDFKKMLKSILFLTMSLVVVSLDARNIAQKGSQATAQSQQRPGKGGRQAAPKPTASTPTANRAVNRAQTTPAAAQQQAQASAPQQDQPVVSQAVTLQDVADWILIQKVPWSPEVEKYARAHWNLLTPQQRDLINTTYSDKAKINLLEKQVQFLAHKMTVQPVGAVQTPTQNNKGWLYSLTGYDSSQLTAEQGMALGAAGAIGTGIAAVTAPVWLPVLGAIATYLGPVGIAKIAGTAYGVNAINFAWKNGAITTQGAIDSRKNLLQLQLTGGMYPTLALQSEALVDNGREELRAMGEDPKSSIFIKACESMNNELVALNSKLSKEDSDFAQRIDNAVGNCRAKHNKDTTSPEDYLMSIQQDTSAKGIAEVLAYSSEYLRTQNQIGLGIAARLEKERSVAQENLKKAEQEAAAAKASTTASGQAPRQDKKPGALAQWWLGTTEEAPQK